MAKEQVALGLVVFHWNLILLCHFQDLANTKSTCDSISNEAQQSEFGILWRLHQFIRRFTESSSLQAAEARIIELEAECVTLNDAIGILCHALQSMKGLTASQYGQRKQQLLQKRKRVQMMSRWSLCVSPFSLRRC